MLKILKTNRQEISLLALVPYLLITFGLAWGVIGLYIFTPERMISLFGQLTGSHPLFYLAVYAPAIAASIIVFYKTGLKGLKGFYSRILLWRISRGWWLFLLIGMPLVFYAGSAWKGNLFNTSFPFSSLSALLIALMLFAIKGPLEEFGWRGFALPLLQRKLAPVWAALIIGVVWGFWHLPAFMLSGTQQSGWAFGPFFMGTIALSVIATTIYNDSRGSILLPAIFHFQCINPLWPDAQPYDTYLFIAVAMVIIWVKREKMFDKKMAVTQIVPK